MRLWSNTETSMPIVPFFIINLYYKMRNKRLKAEGIVYSLIITFMAVFVYAIIYPAFKSILIASYPSMGEVEITLFLVIPVAIFISILWGITWLIQPRRA
jgi:hypothetical protein